MRGGGGLRDHLALGKIADTLEPNSGRRGGMKYRIGMWAIAGFLVASCWALYASQSPPPAMTTADPMLTLVRLTCPIALLGSHPLSLYFVLLANAATYALIGLVVESIRRKLSQAS
jgi:hypothetical protein